MKAVFRMKSFIFKLYLFTLLLIASLSCPAQQLKGIAATERTPSELKNGQFYLIAIGIDKYKYWPRLKSSVNDAKAVVETLQKHYGFSRGNTYTLFNDQATERNILKTLRAIAESLKEEDSLILFYAGHGHLDKLTGSGSWIPVDGELDNDGSWISNDKIRKYLRSFKAKHVLLVSDSCFAGKILRGKEDNHVKISNNYVRTAMGKRSRQALTSGGLEPVLDSGISNHSIFTYFLLQELKNNESAYLLPHNLYDRIVNGVMANATQQPQLGTIYDTGGELGGEFVFFRHNAPKQNIQSISKIVPKKMTPEDLVSLLSGSPPLAKLAKGSREARNAQQRFAEKNGLPLQVRTKTAGIILNLIPPGKFDISTDGRNKTLDIPGFYIGVYEITQEQWNLVMGKNPAIFKNCIENAPVENVSWNDCRKFLDRLCEMEGVPKNTYCLPTEFEWEYACRAGTRTPVYTGHVVYKGKNNAPELDDIAVYSGNCKVNYRGGMNFSEIKQKQYNFSNGGVHCVGTKRPNAFGLYDMLGNVSEWCSNDYHENVLIASRDGNYNNLFKTTKGGNWFCMAKYTRADSRTKSLSSLRINYIGLRIIRKINHLPFHTPSRQK